MTELKSHLSIGNRKIGKDTVIFNITSAADCIADKLGLCGISAKCYAKKAERLYPQVLPYRRRQTELWDKISAHDFALEISDLNKSKARKTRIKYFRLNESGDFRDQSDVDKFAAIATELLVQHGIKSYCYTARHDLKLEFLNRIAVVTMSNYSRPGFNNFVPVPKFTGDNLQCKGDCSTCNLCKVSHGKIIEVEIH